MFMKRIIPLFLFVLLAAQPAVAKEFGDYEPPFYGDVLRLKDILALSENIEAYFKKTGHYPLETDPQTDMHSRNISSYNAPGGPAVLYSKQLTDELVKELGAAAKPHLDPSDSLEGEELREYKYASDGQDYYVSAMLDSEVFYARKRDDTHYLVELSSRPFDPDKQYSPRQLRHFLKYGPDNLDRQIAFSGAVAAKNFTDAKIEIDKGANVNPVCEFSTRCLPLADAAQKGDVETMKFLLDNGADINSFTAFYDVSLTSALSAHQKEAAKFLLDHDAGVNFPNAFGTTPFIGAAAAGDTEMVKLMLGKGALVNRRFIALNSEAKPGETGERPLEAAIHSRKAEVVELLIKAGADVSLTGKANATMLEMAEGTGDKKIIDMVKAATKK